MAELTRRELFKMTGATAAVIAVASRTPDTWWRW